MGRQLLKLSTFFLGCLLSNCKITEEHQVKFAITHWNDVRGQVESFKKNPPYSTLAPPVSCRNPESEVNCVGGLPNLVHWLNNNSYFNGVGVRSENIFRLDSGNQFSGETWNGFQSSMGSYLQLESNIRVLGVNDFMGGLTKVDTKYASKSRKSHSGILAQLGEGDLGKLVLPANTCKQHAEGNLESKFCKSWGKFLILKILNPGYETYNIGVIGFINPIVERLALTGSLQFSPIVESIQAEVRNNSDAKHSIKTFIAIGDGNLDIAKEILDSIPEVKLVIYSDGVETRETIADSYPITYNNRYIATAGRYGSSMGRLILNVYTETGDLQLDKGTLAETVFPGNNSYNLAAKSFLSEMESPSASKAITSAKAKLGSARVRLEGGELCWRRGCNLGNLVADSMVHCANRKFTNLYHIRFHAIWHSGSLAQHSIRAGGRISQLDIRKWLPFHNNIHMVKIKGSDLKRVLNASASGIDPIKAGERDWGQFLQVSAGLEVTYENYQNLSLPPRLARVRIAQQENGTTKLSDVLDDAKYYFVIPTFLYEGRGIYGFARGLWESVMLEFEFEDNCLEEYIRASKQVNFGRPVRIKITTECGESECEEDNTILTVILTLIFLTTFVLVAYHCHGSHFVREFDSRRRRFHID